MGNEPFPLNGREVQTAVAIDLENLVERVKSLLAEHADLKGHYAYPRCRWEISLKVTPFWTDEKPIEIQASGGVESPEGVASYPFEVTMEQPEVVDPDSLRPEKKQEPVRHEEATKTPEHLNSMVRMGRDDG
jgi:hypothetical protein